MCQPNAIPSTRRRLSTIAITLIAVMASGTHLAGADDTRSKTMQSLDQQVQDIKSDVLGIAAGLRELEEKLLYPSNTQLALFVAIANNDDISLDSAKILIDGELVAHHIYSFKELSALTNGGVQRIYTGNVNAGKHQLEVFVQGKHASGRSFDAVEKFDFHKEIDPKNIGITLTAGLAGGTAIEIEDW